MQFGANSGVICVKMQYMVNGVAQQEDKNGIIKAIKEPLPQPLPEEGGE